MSPNLYVIAGPNGAGKTTFAKQFLPNYAECREFVNADLIAGGLSPFSPESAAILAGRLMLERIKELANQRKDFGFETTLSGKAYAGFLKDSKKIGYRIHIFFLWVRSVDIALERVADRVKMGGHNVPEDVVRRRYDKGLSNFNSIYRALSDSWTIFDNSTSTPQIVAYEENGELTAFDSGLFSFISENMELK